MTKTKYCIGIDVSKDSLECCIGSLDEDGHEELGKPRTLLNSESGFKQLLNWANEEIGGIRKIFVMEATGVYYENLAYWLDGIGETVVVVLPNKVKHWSKSLNVKTKTDRKDAQVLSRFGLSRVLQRWKMPSKLMREIKVLCREYRENKEKLGVLKNQLHSKQYSYGEMLNTEKRLKKQISLVEMHVLEVEAELRMLAMSDSALYDKIQKIETIPGVSFMTVICILAETNAFALVTNAKQLVSYAGLDVTHNQSGMKTGKSRISKRGNSFIRNALYMPALCASRHNPLLKEFYSRLVSRKEAKKIAVTAVARKLLVLVYTLWKKEEEFKLDNPHLNEIGRPLSLPIQDELLSSN